MSKLRLLLCCLLLVVGQLSAQNRIIQGVVISAADKETVIGASVVVKGQPTIGTATDLDGKFKLSIPANAKVLRISYIGMATEEVAVQDNLTIYLKPDAQLIEEVVVTGMTKVDKRLFTGASTKVGGDKSKLDGMADAARALEGKAAGVSVQNVSGTFGAAPKIRVRGATSIYGASKPLWVVDGVVMDDVVDVDANDLSSGDATTLISSAIAGLNPDDIESFQVLKDGSATSIYGARAMAGVIVVTTKKGRSGVSKISYTGEYTYRLRPNYSQFNIMNSQQQLGVYAEMEEKGWMLLSDMANAANTGIYGKMWDLVARSEVENTPAGRKAFLSGYEYINTDWFAQLFNNNVMNNHSVSITSGTDKVSFYGSLSALVDPGWTKQSSVNRYTLSLNTTYRLSSKVSLAFLGNASIRRQRAPGTLNQVVNAVSGEVSRGFDINPYSYALNTSRLLSSKEFYTRGFAPFNIHHELDRNYLDVSASDMKFQSELKITPIRGLELVALGAVKYSARSTEHTIKEDSNHALSYRAMGTRTIRDNNENLYTDPDKPLAQPESVLPEGGWYNTTDYGLLAWDLRTSASYNTEIGKSILNTFAGMEINSSDRRNRYANGWGFLHDQGATAFPNYLAFKKLQEENSPYYGLNNTYYRNVAFFANATYSYMGKYTLNGTLRYEGSNKMGRSATARWLPTWNVSGAWNMHNEGWFAKFKPTLSALTLKASYSLTADRGPALVTNSSAIIRSEIPWRFPTSLQELVLYVADSENSALTYEKKHELNLGFDASFLGGRINLSADWYRRNNFDLIGPISTPGLGGSLIRLGNTASMYSSGVELSLSTTNIKAKDFSWVTDFVYAHSKNMITKLDSRNTVLSLVRGSSYSREGYPIGALFSIPFLGLNESGYPTLLNEDGVPTTGRIGFQERERLGHLKYEGTIDPTHYGSLGNTLTYKNWKFNLFLTYSFGNVIRLDPIFRASYNDLSSMPLEFENRWVRGGEEATTDVPAILSRRELRKDSNLRYGYNAYNYSDARVARGDFIRLKEISLAYSFPQAWAKKMFVSDLSLKLQATNLLLLYSDSKLRGQDPEFLNSGGVATPLPRQVTMTLRVGI